MIKARARARECECVRQQRVIIESKLLRVFFIDVLIKLGPLPRVKVLSADAFSVNVFVRVVSALGRLIIRGPGVICFRS